MQYKQYKQYIANTNMAVLYCDNMETSILYCHIMGKSISYCLYCNILLYCHIISNTACTLHLSLPTRRPEDVLAALDWCGKPCLYRVGALGAICRRS
jgi:hypothetical protein